MVIDNPPFSCFKEIVNFYRENGIEFFLFGPALTIGNADASLVITGCNIKYQNGAKVPTEFATNIKGFAMLETAKAKAKAKVKVLLSCREENLVKKLGEE